MTRYCNEQRERDKACCRTNGGALCESVCQVAGPNSTACTVCRLAALALVLACEQTSDNLHEICRETKRKYIDAETYLCAKRWNQTPRPFGIQALDRILEQIDEATFMNELLQQGQEPPPNQSDG
jgi:hypothetical protein